MIGFGPECLIPPRPIGRTNRTSQSSGSRNSGKNNDRRNGRQSSEKSSKGRPSRNGMTKSRPSNSNRGRGSRLIMENSFVYSGLEILYVL